MLMLSQYEEKQYHLSTDTVCVHITGVILSKQNLILSALDEIAKTSSLNYGYLVASESDYEDKIQ